MKTKFFLMTGLLVTAMGFGQSTVYYPTSGTGIAGSGGTKNVHIGYNAGINAGGNSESNTIVGYYAGNSLVNGKYNCFLGLESGFNNDGQSNVFLGHGSGSESTGNFNTFVGRGAGANIAIGSSNIAIGIRAGQQLNDSLAIGDFNIFIGSYAGKNSSGDENIFIGKNVGEGVSGNGKLYIHNSNDSNPLIYGEFNAGLLKFNAKNVGIGYEGSLTNGGFGDFPDTSSLETSTFKYRFFVRGGILAEEVRIRVQNTWSWPDYVFADDYKLMPLNEVEQYITDNGHLPNMPSAEEIEKDGLAISNIVKLQQEKIEELTLHLIEQEKEMELLKAQVKQLLNKE